MLKGRFAPTTSLARRKGRLVVLIRHVLTTACVATSSLHAMVLLESVESVKSVKNVDVDS